MLAIQIGSLEDVEEPLRPYYEEAEDGGFQLVTPLAEAVNGLVSALEKE